MQKIKVHLGRRSYSVIVGNKIFPKLGGLLKRLRIGKDPVIITNPYIKKKYGNKLRKILEKNGFEVKFEIVPDTEKSKSVKQFLKLLNNISAYDKKRTLFIIALGGGVIGDLAGFVAAAYKRGISYVQVPTTLLSQIDSAIGGKVGIDLSVGKNLMGAFYQPRLVFSDISLLSTLDKRQIRSGLAEAIKYGVIKDAKLFNYLETHYKDLFSLKPKGLEFIVSRCSKIKAGVIEQDEQEKKGIRTILNYGHTIGHAIEAAGEYSRYNHGEAIAIGMICAAQIAHKLSLLNNSSLNRIEQLISRVGLPTRISRLKFTDILNAQLHDKKFIRGKNRFVLPVKIGRVIVYEGVPSQIIKSVLKSRLS